MCPHVFSSSGYCICALILLYVSSYCYIRVLLLMMSPHTTIYVPDACKKTYVWHTWVLGEVGDVCAVVELGKLDGKHLSMMLSLVSTDPALP